MHPRIRHIKNGQIKINKKIGFIPLGPLLLTKSNLKGEIGTDPNKLYDISKNSVLLTFLLSNQIQSFKSFNQS